MGRVHTIQAGFQRHPGRGVIFGGVLFVFALVTRIAVDDVLPPGFPFLTFFPAVILATFFAGLWPGVITGAASIFVTWYMFLSPLYSFGLDAGGMVALVFFVVVIVVDIAVIHVMNTALDRLEEERQRGAELSRQAQTMFSELQHRVSNNLQLVSGLLVIQQSKVSDRAALKVLEEARTRVATLGRLHRMLHDPTRQDVDIARFLVDLCRDVISAAGATHVAWEVHAEPVSLPPDKLVPLALIVAELVSNTLEHAFPQERPGRVVVTLGPVNGLMRLAVCDNGRGLPPGFNVEDCDSLGLRIARSLAGQLGGHLTIAEAESGTAAMVEFPK